MCKKNTKGLRPFKGPNRKTFGNKVTKCAKRTPRDFDLSKGSKQITFGKKGASTFKMNQIKRPSTKNKNKNTLGTIETWMLERGRHFSIKPLGNNHSIRTTKRTKPTEDNSVQERGETFSQKFEISSRCFGGNQIVYQSSTKENSPFYINCLRAITR